jgi:small-conductance mechanosensitive channel
MSLDIAPLREFMEGVTGKASPLQWAAQFAIVLIAVLAAWPISRTVCGRVHVNPRWKFGAGEFRRVAFPFFALVLVWVAKLAMEHYTQPVALLDITVALLVAFVLIRLAVYILGHVLPQGATLRLAVRIIAWVAWIGVALHVTGLLPEVLEGLDDVGFTIGKTKTRVTLLLILQAVAAMAVTLTLALWAARITESRVLAAQTVEMSTRVVIVKLVRTFAIILAILVALPMAGIDITALSIFSGAVGVGLGFGLQKVASNYVSGFIVLLERSLRIGDVITVDNKRGVVQAIESRYTVLKAGDGTETIIPNEDMITKQVIHHTYSDPKVATVLTVSVTYATDAEHACEALAEIGKRNARAIGDPAPHARVVGLGDNGIQLELTVWIDDPEKGEADLRSELLKDILRTFRAKGIEVAAPRRDVRRIATPEMPESPSTSRA